MTPDNVSLMRCRTCNRPNVFQHAHVYMTVPDTVHVLLHCSILPRPVSAALEDTTSNRPLEPYRNLTVTVYALFLYR